MGISRLIVMAAAGAGAVLMSMTVGASAAAIRAGFDANALAANDDLSTSLVPIGFSADFFGVVSTKVYVNNNGNITFDLPLRTFTPFNLTSTERQIIAPFFADVDTRAPGSGLTTYGTGMVDGFNAFGVTWIGVGYYDRRDDLLNSFQLILIDRSDTGAGNFDIEFNYDTINWETGDASAGREGFGGFSARAGFSNGTGVAGTFFELPGSAVNGAFLDAGPLSTALILNMLNSDVAGRYVFEARNGAITVPDFETPIPGAFVLMLSSLCAGFGVRNIFSRKAPHARLFARASRAGSARR